MPDDNALTRKLALSSDSDSDDDKGASAARPLPAHVRDDSEDDDDDDDDLDVLARRANMSSGSMLSLMREEQTKRTSLRAGVVSAPEPAGAAAPPAVVVPSPALKQSANNERSDSDEPDDDKDGAGGDDDDDDDVDLAAAVLQSQGKKSSAAGGKSPRSGAAAPAAGGAAAPVRAKRAAPEVARQLRFLGKHFNALKDDEVKHVVEAEKAKRDVYLFEWEANEQKPEWKQALLTAAMRPSDGVKLLLRYGLIKDAPEAKAKVKEGEWMCARGSAAPLNLATVAVALPHHGAR